MAHIVKLIFTEERCELGENSSDPIRRIPQLWTLDGKLVCEADGSRPDADEATIALWRGLSLIPKEPAA